MVALVVGCAAYLVLGVLGDYASCWMHPEIAGVRIPMMLRYGTHLDVRDWATIEPQLATDGGGRMRFWSHVLMLLNEKLRLAAFHFVPPHPSASLTWLFTFLVAPALLFDWVVTLTQNRRAAWVSIPLYLASPGTLSSGSLLFHPGKPMANVAILLALCIGTRLAKASTEGRFFGLRGLGYYAAFLVVQYLGLFWDEGGWFAIPACVVVMLGLFRQHPYTVLGPPLVSLALFLTPLLVAVVLGHEFDAWTWATGALPGTSGSAENMRSTIAGLWSDHLLPLSRLGEPLGVRQPMLSAGLLGLIGVIFALKFVTVRRDQRWALAQLTVLLVGFVVYQAAVSLRHMGSLKHCFYYGLPFSIVFAAWAAPLFASARSAMGQAFEVLVVAGLVAVGCWNFRWINQDWMAAHEQMMAELVPDWTSSMVRGGVLDYPLVVNAWRVRGEPEPFSHAVAALPINAAWLPVEMEAMKGPAHANHK